MELLSIEEICNIVKKNYERDDVAIVEYTINPISETPVGFLGEHFWLRVEVEVAGVEDVVRFFVKAVPVNMEMQREFVVDSGAFEKEIVAYTKLFTHMKTVNMAGGTIWYPRYFYSRDNIIVLEDITKDGYIVQPEALDLEHVIVALRTLAYMHGQCLAFEENLKNKETNTLKGSHWMEIKDVYPKVVEETAYPQKNLKSQFRKWMDEVVPKMVTVVDLLEGYTEEERETIRKELAGVIYQVYDLTDYSKRFKSTFNHGDLWTNNILFRYENNKPVEARIVDFQLNRYLPPVHDVYEIFFHTTSKAFRLEHEKTVKDVYYGELIAELQRQNLNLEQIISRKEFDESWEYYRKLGLIRSCTLLPFVLTPAEVFLMAFQSPQHYEKFVFEDRVKYIAMCFKYPEYKKRVSDVFNELIERYILN